MNGESAEARRLRADVLVAASCDWVFASHFFEMTEWEKTAVMFSLMAARESGAERDAAVTLVVESLPAWAHDLQPRSLDALLRAFLFNLDTAEKTVLTMWRNAL